MLKNVLFVRGNEGWNGGVRFKLKILKLKQINIYTHDIWHN